MHAVKYLSLLTNINKNKLNEKTLWEQRAQDKSRKMEVAVAVPP